MTVITSPPGILRHAAELIEQGGLAKHAYVIRNGKGGKSYCLIGAVEHTLIEESPFDMFSVLSKSIERRLAEEIYPEFDGDQDTFPILAHWNDDPNTTQEDVVNLLMKVAENFG